MVLITNVLLLQFLLGVAIGLLLPKLNFQRTVVLFILTLSIITFFLYYFNYFEFYLSDLVVCGLLVFSVILLDTSNIHMKVSSMLIYLGDISYSIYLVHIVIIQIIYVFFIESTSTSVESNFIGFVLTIVLTLLSSVILYEVIEKRFTNYLKGKYINPKFL